VAVSSHESTSAAPKREGESAHALSSEMWPWSAAHCRDRRNRLTTDAVMGCIHLKARCAPANDPPATLSRARMELLRRTARQRGSRSTSQLLQAWHACHRAALEVASAGRAASLEGQHRSAAVPRQPAEDREREEDDAGAEPEGVHGASDDSRAADVAVGTGVHGRRLTVRDRQRSGPSRPAPARRAGRWRRRLRREGPSRAGFPTSRRRPDGSAPC